MANRGRGSANFRLGDIYSRNTQLNNDDGLYLVHVTPPPAFNVILQLKTSIMSEICVDKLSISERIQSNVVNLNPK